MRTLVLLLLAVVLSRPIDVRGRRHELTAVHEFPKRQRGANLAEITPESQNNTEVVAQLGGTASIKCYTHFFPEETQVTWLKRDEDQLLTAGQQVYISESRYSVSHVRHQQLWELSVRDVKQSDAGVYECQLTSYPPTSLFFILKVVEARAVLQGGPDMHVHTGASLRLHCTLHHATETPEFIFWYHNGSMINYAPRRPLKVVKHHYSSVLVIADVRWDDAGQYRCEPHMARAANLTLHVIAGEKHAALHNGQGEGEEHTSDATVTTPATTTTTTLFIASGLLVLFIQHVFGTVMGNQCGLARINQKLQEEEEEAKEEEEGYEEEEKINSNQKQVGNNGDGEERRIMEEEEEKGQEGEEEEVQEWRYS